MNSPRPQFGLFLLVFTLTAMNAAPAQGPFALLHSLFDPGTNAQIGAGQGFSVAVSGDTAVVGAPFDDVGTTNSGVAKVYDARTGALLHVLTNPFPAFDGNFGYSVGISGTRVVVSSGTFYPFRTTIGRVFVYDLAGPSPTAPSLTLTNPSSNGVSSFGGAVAISGERIVVGTLNNVAYAYDLTSQTPSAPVVTFLSPTSTGFQYFGGSVGISGTRVVIGALWESSAASRSGRAYVYDLSSFAPASPILTLANPSPTVEDYFGGDVAISGDLLVVGAPWDDAGTPEAGTVYCYDLGRQLAAVPMLTLTNPSPTAGDKFGHSVSISGTRVVVGQWVGLTAHVFDLAGNAPTIPIATLDGSRLPQAGQFANAVAISGARVVVGAWEYGLPPTRPGAAYVYDFSGTPPTMPSAVLASHSPTLGDLFGGSVAVAGTKVVVGATGDDTGGENKGAAYVYDITSPTPLVPPIVLRNPTGSSLFGSPLAMSGTRVVVGVSFASAACVYDLAGSNPSFPIMTLRKPGLQNTEAFGFGAAVAISGTRVAVGAPQEDDPAAYDSGSAYIFDVASPSPTTPVATLTNPSPAVGDYFGWSIAISGTRVLVGAYADDTGTNNAGSAYVYELTSATPTVPLLTLTNPTPGDYDDFGYSVAISGTWAVVGAPFVDAGALDAGSAFVYDLASAIPSVAAFTLKAPSPVAHNLFGLSVVISGTRVVVGARWGEAEATYSGTAYVYDLASATPTVPISTVSNPTPGNPNDFGGSLGIDGTTIVVGAPYDDTGTTDRGAAYIFGLLPALRIIPTAPGFATISWTPSTSSGFVLQYSDNLAPANWVNAPSGAANPVTVPLANPSRFYRLAQP